MEFSKSVVVVAIVALTMVGWLVNNWMRTKHGYALEDFGGGKTERTDNAETQRLQVENRALHDKLDAMQDRMIVLEKIVTDRGYSLAEEIEALRETRRLDNGSARPLGPENKERV